jgi:hypothetical protein
VLWTSRSDLEITNTHRISAGKPREIRPLGKPRTKWEDNIKIDLREKGCVGEKYIRLAQHRVQ